MAVGPGAPVTFLVIVAAVAAVMTVLAFVNNRGSQ